MDAAHLFGYGLGALVGIGAVVVSLFRSKAVNRDDPLQGRLANHLSAYVQSLADDAALVRLKADLKAELKARSVPQEEWEFRVTSASGLMDPNIGRERRDVLFAAISRLKLTP